MTRHDPLAVHPAGPGREIEEDRAALRAFVRSSVSFKTRRERRGEADGMHTRLLIEPGDARWEHARRAWNLAIDQRPAAVIEAAAVDDVVAAVEYARRNGLRVAPQATGHGAAALGPLDDTVLLNTSGLRAVAVRPDTGVARVGAGARAGAVADAAGAHRLAPVAGLAAGVGMTGLTLGGGIGWLSRRHGLACNNVRAIELVTAAGEALRVDAAHEPELFGALRGGGGSFAIVTALELELHPVEAAFAGTLTWPAARAADVLEEYRRWSEDAPETLSSVFRYLAFPGAPPVVSVTAVHLGGQHDGERLLHPLRAARTAETDSFASVPAAQLVRVAGDPEEPLPAVGHGLMVDALADGLLDALAARIAGGGLAPLGVLELRRLGGALGRAPAGHGALAKLDGGFAVFASGMPGDRAAQRLEELRAELAPWTTPQPLLNSNERAIDPAPAFTPATWRALRRVRTAFDPDGLIVARHPVPMLET
jgi:FAD/FMN-containing dehydrogenase